MPVVAPDPAAENGLIPLSALQHYLFCPRQCALIHIEQLWAEDGRTAEGRLLHERVDAGGAERRAGVRIERGVALRSLALGIAGRADVVEFHGTPPQPFPVEYKRGKPKPHRADEVQLCAQAICLEEMCGSDVLRGALFYGETRRRTEIVFDAALRTLTEDVARQARAMISAGATPPPVLTPGCRHCSLHDACCPERLQRPIDVEHWLSAQLTE